MNPRLSIMHCLFRRFIHPSVLVWSLALMILGETLLAQGNLANSGEFLIRFINSSYWRPLAYVVNLGQYEADPRVKPSVR